MYFNSSHGALTRLTATHKDFLICSNPTLRVRAHGQRTRHKVSEQPRFSVRGVTGVAGSEGNRRGLRVSHHAQPHTLTHTCWGLL